MACACRAHVRCEWRPRGARASHSPVLPTLDVTTPGASTPASPSFKPKRILSWLTSQQRERADGLAGRLDAPLTADEKRFCEGIGLLTPDRDAAWHRGGLHSGGAQLIMSPSRRHLWPHVPLSLRLVGAVMGAKMSPHDLRDMQSWARRDMSPGEIGIVLSNGRAWEHAVSAGWDWTLVLEDDAAAANALKGGLSQLLALLPELIDSAKAQDAEWQLLALSPVGLEPFYGLCRPQDIPSLYHGSVPAGLRKPQALGDSGWMRIGPTFHAFGWVYRRPLMVSLLSSLRRHQPLLNPLDVYVWEVMATHNLLGHALAPLRPLITTTSTPGGSDSLRAATGLQGTT